MSEGGEIERALREAKLRRAAQRSNARLAALRQHRLDPEASLHSIARRAGVGTETLKRWLGEGAH